MQQASPVQASERELFMDVLRGFAILGIFIANLGAFSWYGMSGPDATGPFLSPNWDHKMQFLHHVFIEGKFYSIFSFLFGWGFALQLMRSEKKGINAVPLVRRRLAVMLLLGACHLLLWPGDIVFFYALLGFLLLSLRKLSNKILIITSILLILSPILLYGLKMMFPVLNYPAELLFKTGGILDKKLIGVTDETTFKAFIQTTSWFDILKGDISGFFYRYGDLFFISRIPKVLGMMLLGLVVGRTEFYKNLEQYKKLLVIIIITGIVVGLPANYMLAKYMDLNDGSYFQLKTSGLYRTIAYALGVAPLAAAYISILMLAFRQKTLHRVMSLTAPVGKMAFSNYITHTLVGNFVLLHAGLGYMGKVGPLYYTAFAVIVFTAQIIISTVWLKYFNYGPLEWIWRSLTYKKWQSMKK